MVVSGTINYDAYVDDDRVDNNDDVINDGYKFNISDLLFHYRANIVVKRLVKTLKLLLNYISML